MAPTSQQIIARRRALALVVLALIVSLIWGIPQLFANPNSGAQPSATASVEETQSAPAAITECAAGVVKLEAFVGTETQETKNSFQASENPYLWYEITNTGIVDCTFNLGARATFFTITSGEQTYWSSRDCDREGLSDTMTLLPSNQTLKSTPSMWLKVVSAAEGCGEGMSPVPTGGASYHLKAEVNGLLSENTQQFLLY